MLCGDVGLLCGMNVGCDGNIEVLGYFTQDTATFLDAGAAEGVDGRAVSLVKRRLEQEMNAGAPCDFFE